MKIITPKVALYYHTLGLNEDEGAVIQKTFHYCQQNHYQLQYLYKDTGLKKPIFHHLQEAMDHGTFDILCISTLLQIHCTHMGQALHFLMKAQSCHIEVICLDPQPVNLLKQSLVLTSCPTQRQPFTLGDCMRYLRFQ